MAAAEFYNTGPRPGGSYDDDGYDRQNTHSPISSISNSASPVHKPLPSQPSFPPTHAATGYNDDFFGRPHSTQSIDTAYHPHAFDQPTGPSYSSPYSPHDPYGKSAGPYNDDIPLNDTRPDRKPSHSLATVEGGGHAGSKGKKGNFSLLRSNKGRRPWFCYLMAVIQISVFIGELARNAVLTKTPIAIKPQFNPMIGPSVHVLINMGARFVPCMKTIEGITDNPVYTYPCPNTTVADTSREGCSLAEWCGFNGANIPSDLGGTAPKGGEPNQWYRFITPIFLHAGLIHIAFNMLVQLKIGTDMEREIGHLRFAIVYFASGIFGFVFGGNYAPNGQPSTGCSGSLFGIFALILLDLIWSWGSRKSPKKDLAFLLFQIIICFVIGLLPGLDNFSHIGGFLMGLFLGLTVLHSPPSIRQKIGAGEPPYTPMAVNSSPYAAGPHSALPGGFRGFFKNPAGFFKGRKPLWWAWWLVRAATLATALIVMIVLINNFYKFEKTCGWCKYLSCLPVLDWCEMGGLTMKNVTTTSSDGTSDNPARMLARSLASTDLSQFL
ncbi:rhomboid-domain-containing protein [Tuber magnatum]|uniref:Rhomboid-type serine protease n=1 Tax=Tuber magnatum TaxID=42249 RepID=A0A317T0K6_9PEZI|nr:rhomboid-domain-containing protein [Tuber magnatum]